MRIDELGGVVAGRLMSAPDRNGRPAIDGIGADRSVTPSRPASNANRPFSRLARGAIAGVSTFVPFSVSTSLPAPWSPHSSL